MDDATLSNLIVTPSGLMPSFNRNTYDYELVVGSATETLKIKAATNDKSASYSAKCGDSYGDDLKLKEGVNRVVIEVTSEDGTTKKYNIECKRLSASDAKLKLIELKNVELRPNVFNSEILTYETNVDANVREISFKLIAYDAACGIEINANKRSLTSSSKDVDGEYYTFQTNYGHSQIEINVSSPNKKANRIYVVTITRNPVPRLLLFKNDGDISSFQDPISLNAIHCSISLRTTTTTSTKAASNNNNNNKVTFSKSTIGFISKQLKNESLNYFNLTENNNNNNDLNNLTDIEFDNKLSNSLVYIPQLSGNLTHEVKLCEAFELLNVDQSNNNSSPAVVQIMSESELKSYKPTHIISIPDSYPEYQTKQFEKYLQIIYDESDGQKLYDKGRSHIDKYLSQLNSKDLSWRVKKDTNDSPIYHLNMSIYHVATSLKSKNRDYSVHLLLAKLIEEKYYFESIYGAEKKEDDRVVSLKTQNKEAYESGREDEINAICKLRNVSVTASDAEKLKALDLEYHHLLDTKQSEKAEQVQLLYQFKAQRIHNKESSGGGGGGKTNASSNDMTMMMMMNNLKLESNQKYYDAMTVLSNMRTENEEVSFHLGRSYFLIGDHSKAMAYLKIFLNASNNDELKVLGKFYFALCLSKSSILIDANPKIIVHFLLNGLQLFLNNIINKDLDRKMLFADDHYNLLNISFIDAFLMCGKIKLNSKSVKFDSINSENSFK